MSDIVPRLDDVEFDELVERARALIPMYAPDWTDHNLHDPGVTLIDLVAWLTDQQIYRTGYVGSRHRRAFASLLGQRPEGPQPATGLVWPDEQVAAGRQVAAGSKVICQQHPDLPFVLERTIYLPPVALVGVGLIVNGVELPLPSLGGVGSAAGGAIQVPNGAIVSLRFDGPLGSTAGPEAVSLGVEVTPPPGTPPSPELPWGPVDFTYRVGSDPWVAVAVIEDGTAGLALPGAVILEIPPTPDGATGSSELRLSFDRGFFPVAPQIRAASINVLPVVQLVLQPAGRVADGTGQPDQRVELETDDLVAPPSRAGEPALVVKVDNEIWEPRPNLAASGPGDRHYLVAPDGLRFGNGLNGSRPVPGATIATAELARTQGTAGNLRHGLSWTVPALDHPGGRYGTNRFPLSGGADATSVDELVVGARDATTERTPALTDHELVQAAYGLPGMAVARAEVLPGFDRRLTGRRVPDARTLIVVPAAPAGSGVSFPVAADLIAEVAARLEQRRVLGERLVVQGPTVVAVDVELVLTVEPGSVEADVYAAAERSIRNRLSPVQRVTGIEPWPIGRELTASDVAAVAATVPGVVTVSSVVLAEAGSQPTDGAVAVPPDGVVEANLIEISGEIRPDRKSGCGR